MTIVRLTFTLLLAFSLAAIASAQKEVMADPAPSIGTTLESVQNGIFISKGGGFSLAIAQIPSQTIEKGRGKAAGRQFTWVFERTLYTAMYLPSAGDPPTGSFEDMQHGTETAVLRDGGKIISEKPIKCGGYAGIEFRYVSAKGVHFINRSYIVGAFGYQIVGGYADEKDEKAVLDVLDSFKLLIDKPSSKSHYLTQDLVLRTPLPTS
jgi:hypothetical protein